MDQTTINPARYTYYKQLDLSVLNRTEFRRFIKKIKDTPYYDGNGGLEDKIVFFKYAKFKPKKESEVEAYLKVNSNDGASMMNTIYKAIEEFTGYKIERGNTL